MKYYIYTGDHSDVIRSDFNEITNLRIINQLKENLQNHKFCITTNHDRIASDLTFIKKFVSQMNELNVDANELNSNDIVQIRDKLSNSNVKVSFVV